MFLTVSFGGIKIFDEKSEVSFCVCVCVCVCECVRYCSRGTGGPVNEAALRSPRGNQVDLIETTSVDQNTDLLYRLIGRE